MKKYTLLTVLSIAVCFTFFFYKQDIGLNLLLFDFLVLSVFIFSRMLPLNNINAISIFAGTILTSVFTVINYSGFAIFTNIISFYLLVGVIVYPETKSLINSFRLATYNTIYSQLIFVNRITSVGIPGVNLKRVSGSLRISLIPLFIIGFFVLLYKSSNPVFEKYLNISWSFIADNFDFITKIDGLFILIFLLGLAISAFIFMSDRKEDVIADDVNGNDVLTRKRKSSPYKKYSSFGLKNELRSAIFLLSALNILILIINAIDIYWVWFNFSWNGQYLKQFVHEGTYLLILSTLISIGIILYFFRGNLNFFRNNQLLKVLSYAWLIQNGVLLISVAIRNFWYIQYFALAYKRIGVLFFLILTLVGIITVFIKIKNTKSSFYLFRTNSLALYFCLVIISAFNWDNIIARYNLSHAGSSFVHFNFLATLPDKTLPVLDKSLEELETIQSVQKQKFPFSKDYMAITDYHHEIQTRKESFITKWETKSFLSWNYAESAAYKKLKGY